jgi:hypothetical protein
MLVCTLSGQHEGSRAGAGEDAVAVGIGIDRKTEALLDHLKEGRSSLERASQSSSHAA